MTETNATPHFIRWSKLRHVTLGALVVLLFSATASGETLHSRPAAPTSPARQFSDSQYAPSEAIRPHVRPGNLKVTRPAASASRHPLSAKYRASGANCTAFVQADGNLGSYGQVIRQELLNNSRIGNVLLSNNVAKDDQIRHLCPKFANMSQENKVRFWVWTFAAIAWAESTCKPGARARGTNDTAIGLLQLEQSQRLRRGRGKRCNVPSVTDPTNNLLCGLDSMRGQFEGEYGRPSLRSSQWQKLRGKGYSSSIKDRLREFPPCR